MSFSADTKKELEGLSNLSNKEQVTYELIGYLISSNTSIIDNKIIKYATESEYNISRFSKLLNNKNINYNIEVNGKWFINTIKAKELKIAEISNNEINIKIENKEKEDLVKALIRGTFLGSGSINDPQKKYHLEISFSTINYLEMVTSLIKKFNIKVKKLITKGKFTIYIKEGEEISKFLALIGATNAVMKFEDIRAQREMRGKVNRLVNCKTANLTKTINASIEQIEAIQKLKKEKRFNKLDENLKEIAILRLENPDMSLIDLGKKLKNPLGKSGVNYRLKKIIEIANNEK